MNWRVPLHRRQQRTVAACLETAMDSIGLPKPFQSELVAAMSSEIEEVSGTAGGFDNYFSLRGERYNAQDDKEDID